MDKKIKTGLIVAGGAIAAAGTIAAITLLDLFKNKTNKNEDLVKTNSDKYIDLAEQFEKKHVTLDELNMQRDLFERFCNATEEEKIALLNEFQLLVDSIPPHDWRETQVYENKEGIWSEVEAIKVEEDAAMSVEQ
jgi:hypothetical protein